MAITAAQLLVKVSADTKGAEEGLGKVNDHVKKTGGFFKDALSSALGFAGGAAIVSGVGTAVGFVKDNLSQMVSAGEDANRMAALLAQGLRSTHDASGMTAQSLDDLSTKIMNNSGIDDDAVKSAEQMLLTFTGIGKQAFPAATQAAADMATRMNGGMIPTAQQMNQVALQLGKALNDPAQGMMMLRREGVTFTTQQQAQIKAMEKAGNTAGAQALMLKELNKEFGGSAHAAGEANGGMAILSAQFDNMKQTIGQAIIPLLTQLLQALQPLATTLSDALPGAIKVVSDTFAKWKPLITDIIGDAQIFASTFLTALKPALDQVGKALSSAHGPGTSMAQVLNKVADVAQRMTPFFQQAGQAVGKLATWFVSTGLPALHQFGEFIEKNVLPTLLQVGGFIATTVLPALGQLADWVVTKVVPALEQIFKWFSVHVLPILEQVVKVVVTDVLPTLESIANTVMSQLVPAIEHLWNKISPVLIPALQFLGAIIKNVVGPALQFIITVISKVIDIVATVIGKVGDFMGVLGNLKDKIGSAIGDMLGKVGQFKDNFLKTFGDLPGKLFDMGKNLIQKLIDGITGMASNLQREAGKAIRGALSNIPGVGGLLSHLPHFASGGTMGTSGIAVVGEAGPELVKLPAGAQVYSASQSAAMFSRPAPMVGRSAQPVHIHVNIAGQDVAEAILPDIVDTLRSGTGVREF